jgi:hypothetical protein
MRDFVYEAFLENAARDADRANAESDILRLVARPRSDGPPSLYVGELTDVEHFERAPARGIRDCSEPISFSIHFPPHYLRSGDPTLQFRVARAYTPLFHPNVSGRLVCLGTDFACGTRLRPLLEQVYGIFSSQIFATDHAFDPDARDYYLDHGEEVRALRAPPLWRRPVASEVTVVTLDFGGSPRAGEAT